MDDSFNEFLFSGGATSRDINGGIICNWLMNAGRSTWPFHGGLWQSKNGVVLLLVVLYAQHMPLMKGEIVRVVRAALNQPTPIHIQQ